MKTRLLKISMLATVLMFLFAGASWADRDRGRHRDSRPAKRIEAKHHRGRDHHRPARYRHKIKRYRKHFYRHHHRHHYRKRPALRYWRHHRFYHRHKWIAGIDLTIAMTGSTVKIPMKTMRPMRPSTNFP